MKEMWTDGFNTVEIQNKDGKFQIYEDGFGVLVEYKTRRGIFSWLNANYFKALEYKDGAYRDEKGEWFYMEA